MIGELAETDAVSDGGRDYDADYRDGTAPWEIGGPQPALAASVAGEMLGPKVLDLGCGTGDLAIALARRGFDVTGVDISSVGIDIARAKAAHEGLNVRFKVQDATNPVLPEAPFDSVVDSGLLHNLARPNLAGADEYLAVLPRLAAPGGRLFVLGVSAEAGEGWTITDDYLRSRFAEPTWTGTRIEKISVHAEVDGQHLTMPGFLLHTTRTG
jgi:ubiquinone/menaquinone biosynthesis C-methylase UbiE